MKQCSKLIVSNMKDEEKEIALAAWAIKAATAQTYLQPHYGNGVFGNVYLSAGQHYKEVNIASTPLS